MDNYFTRAFKGAINPSTYQGALPSLNGSSFYEIGSFFGYSYGAANLGRYLKAYGKNALVYMIVRRIAVTTAGLERIVVDSEGVLIEDSEIARIMEKPNDNQGTEEFYEAAVENLMLTGNTFIAGTDAVGMGVEDIEVLNSSKMELHINRIGEPSHWIYNNNMGNRIRYELDEILHIKTSNVVHSQNETVYFGLSPLEAAWAVVKSSDEIFSAEASIFKNRGIIGILTNETDTPMLEPERQQLQEQFDQEVGGADQYNKIKISNTKLKYIQTGMSPTDLKLLEGIMNKLRILCSVYGLSSVLFNDNDNSTYNNVTTAEVASYNNVFLPLARKIDRELSVWLSKKLSVDEFIKVDKTKIEVLKGSTNEVAQALNNLPPQVARAVVGSGTRNEVRDLVGWGELENKEQGAELVGDGKAETEKEDKTK